MKTLFIGDTGTEIVLDCGIDVSSATARKIIARKPSGTRVEWTAAAEGSTSIKYVTQADDLNVAGEWALQAHIEMPDWIGSGDVVRLQVLPSV